MYLVELIRHLGVGHYVSTLLEILDEIVYDGKVFVARRGFQPFLRFWGSRIWFLWVFKFFFGFLSSRRSV